MKLRTTLPLLALLACTPCLAQNEVIITEEPVAIPEQAQDPNEPFTVVEEMPQFPGGQEALFAYIGKEMKYPEDAVENGVQGVVYVTFVVETDGKISGARVLRGFFGECDKEALRVVSGMPNWIPGKQRGKEVRVQYNLPIRFKL
ncbi:MAG: energy transducer TonB [Flavobacteriales bacterium]